MISDEQQLRVEQLLAEGKLSQRQIALLTGVSRGCLRQIAAGRRPLTALSGSHSGDDQEQAILPPVRCIGCGGLVYLPCQLCRVRRWQACREARQRRARARRAIGCHSRGKTGRC